MAPRLLTVGHACIDIVQHVSHQPTPDSKASASSSRIQIGGNAANAAVALARMGADVDLCGTLGSKHDPMAQMLVRMLESARVNFLGQYMHGEPTPISMIMIQPNGERIISSHQSPALVHAVHAPTDLEGYQMVLGDNYRLEMVHAVFHQARKRGIPTMLDLDGKIFDNLHDMPQTDHAWFSKESLESLDPSLRSLRLLQDHFGGVVGVTDGPNTIYWIDQAGTPHQYSPPRVHAENTLGAGDVFRASLALNLCNRRDLTQAIEKACVSACEHITNKPLSRITGEKI